MKKFITLTLILILLLLCGCHKEKVDNNIITEETSSTSLSNTFGETSNVEVDTMTDNDTNNTVSTSESFDSYSKTNDYSEHIIDLAPICQYPELPTGCEVTSLAMVLNFYGVNCDKCEIADEYLTKGDVGTVDFHQAFEGDPRDEYSYGCYANVIVETANKIIADKRADLSVKNFTDTPLEELFSFIDDNAPVIVWGTQDCQEGHFSVTWNVNGQDLTWFTPEHCMVLIGYDENSVWVADPIYGDTRSYNKVIFEECYNSLFKQAIVIKPVGGNNSEVSEMRD